MNPKAKKCLMVGIYSISSIALVACTAMTAILAYTRHSLSKLEFDQVAE
jgi:hypothetical protein